jgi:hypothetical protein
MRVLLRRSTRLVLIYTVATSTLIALALLTVLPVNCIYYALDGTGLGHLELAKRSSAWLYTLRDLQGVEPGKALLVVAGEEPLGYEGLEQVLEFVERGGAVIFYGSESAIKKLFEHLGIAVAYLGGIVDPVYSVDEPSLVLVNMVSTNTTLLLDSPYCIQVLGRSEGIDVEPLAYTSAFSYIDSNSDGLYSVGEPLGSFPVAYSIRLGSGELLVFCARGVLTNAVFNYNVKWLEGLADARSVLLDQSWTRTSWLLYLKLLVNTSRGASPLYISLLTAVIVLVAVYAYGKALEKS